MTETRPGSGRKAVLSMARGNEQGTDRRVFRRGSGPDMPDQEPEGEAAGRNVRTGRGSSSRSRQERDEPPPRRGSG